MKERENGEREREDEREKQTERKTRRAFGERRRNGRGEPGSFRRVTRGWSGAARKGQVYLVNMMGIRQQTVEAVKITPKMLKRWIFRERLEECEGYCCYCTRDEKV